MFLFQPLIYFLSHEYLLTFCLAANNPTVYSLLQDKSLGHPLWALRYTARAAAFISEVFRPACPISSTSTIILFFGDGYKHLLICLQAFKSSLFHSSQNLLFKNANPIQLLPGKTTPAAVHGTWGTMQIRSPSYSFLQAFCCGDEARPHACASPQRSSSSSCSTCKSSHWATTAQQGAAPHLAVTYSGGFGKGLRLRLVFVSSLTSSFPHKIRRKDFPSLLLLVIDATVVCVKYITDFLSSYIFFTFIRSFVLCVYVTHTHVHAMEHVWRSEDSSWKSGLSLYHVNVGTELNLGGNCLYQLSHLISHPAPRSLTYFSLFTETGHFCKDSRFLLVWSII